MITNKDTEGYKLAERLIIVARNEGEKAAQIMFERETKGLKFWEQLAIKDTVLGLLNAGR